MKKYSSYKFIKPLNTTLNYPSKPPLSPLHTPINRKLTPLDVGDQRCIQKSQVYPLSSKYSNLTGTNAVRKKMFSNRSQQTPVRPLTLAQKNHDEISLNAGYGNIRTKINNLENKLNQIKNKYDESHKSRKCSEKQKQSKFGKEIDRSVNAKYNPNPSNKQNQRPKQKTQSKLLLERYHANQKQRQAESVRRIHPQEQGNHQLRSPLSPKGLTNVPSKIADKKLVLNEMSAKDEGQQPNDSTENDNGKRSVLKVLNSPKGQSSYLKEYVTTFTCDNKLPLSHSTSETNLYKPHNKLSLGKGQQKMVYYISAILNAFESKNLTSFDNLCRNHLSTSLDILTYVKNAKKEAPAQYRCKPLPPVKNNRQTIVFDLDETLIHCNQNLTLDHDVALPIKFPNGAVLKAGINIRPYARQCLKELSKYFELIVFTASHECYGNVIVDHLDPNKEFISHRYFRDSCFKTEEGFYVKDLRVIDRDLKKLLLIDNAAYSYCFQLQNGVPIVPFYDNKADLELKNLVPYLKSFIGTTDVRVKNELEMKLSKYTNFKDVKSLISGLYTSQE